MRNAVSKLTAGNKSVEGAVYQALAFLLPLGLPALVFRNASDLDTATVHAQGRATALLK